MTATCPLGCLQVSPLETDDLRGYCLPRGPLGDDPDSDGATAISDEMGPSGSSFEQLQEGGLHVRCTTTSGCLFFFRILGALCGRRGSVQLGGLSHMTL